MKKNWNRFPRVILFLTLLTSLLAGVSAPTLVDNSVSAAPMALAASNIVISEFRVRGTNGGNDEFIELYNPTDVQVDISGWLIRGSSNTGGQIDRVAISAGKILLPGQHYLITNSSTNGGPYSGLVPGDQTYGSGIADSGGIALTLSDGTTIIDQVGMTSCTGCYYEVNPLADLGTPNLNQGYERDLGGANGSCMDSGDNASDFTLIAPSDPQNSASPPIECISVTGVSSIANGTYTTGATISIDVTFSGIVNVTGAPTLLLETGTTDRNATYSSGSGSTTLTFDYTVIAGDVSGDLDYVATNSLSLNGGTITCATGDAALTLPSPGTTGSLGANNAIVIDNLLPPNVTVDQAVGQADPATTLPINFAVIFSEPIDVSTFIASDITQNGTATGITWDITDTGNHMNFTLSATAVTGGGTLIPSIAAGQVQDASGSNNLVSTNATADFTVTYTPTPTNTPTSTSTITATPTVTPGPVAALTLLINEVAWAGTSSTRSGDEWIELYNTGTISRNLNGWRLTVDDGTAETDLAVFSASDVLPAGGFFLLARPLSGACTGTDNINIFTDVVEDKCFSTQLTNSPGQIMRLYDSFDTLVDTANSDGGAWPAGSVTNYSSMERRGKILDNINAWVTYAGTPFAHNRDNALVRGTPKSANWFTTITPTPTRTIAPPTRRPSATNPPPVGRPIINEFLARPGFDWNQDGKVDVYDEFIEITNTGNADINIGGWTLDDEESVGSEPFALPSVTLKIGERMVFYGLQTNILLSDGGDTVRLMNPSGKIYDARTYSIVKAEDESVCRLPNGYGDWYKDCVPTPGLLNTREGVIPSMPDGEDFESPVCNLPDTLPADFLFAECRGFGANIWDSFYWDKFGWQGVLYIQENKSKWESFVE